MLPSYPRVGAAATATGDTGTGLSRMAAALATLGAVTLLAACGSQDEGPQPAGDDRIVDKQWQVVSINIAPDAASTIPESIPNAPEFSFGESTMVGTTGCTRLAARLTYTANNERENIRDGNKLHFDEVKYDDTYENCEGGSVWADNLLRNLFTSDNNFIYTINSNNQLILELDTDEVDSPSIKLVSRA
ncbi:hypothetical protein [Corynebacterium macginleyi]|uniref:hypothetical protein n=1 Tax=Corynebacterium macginleyi TaxID=38290 RepID=UPI001F1FD519|nr:hypothetical protein [Corynebacterium macginleyi]